MPAPTEPFASPDGGNSTRDIPSQPDPNGFMKFQHNIAFLNHVHKNKMVPMWLHPGLASQLLAQHAHTGHAIPHPMINPNDLTK